MKAILATVVLVLAVSCQVFAQAKPAAPAKGASVEQELIKLENDWNDAMVKRDLAALSRILADDWTFIDDEGTVVTKAQSLANFQVGCARGVLRSGRRNESPRLRGGSGGPRPQYGEGTVQR